MRTNQVLGMLRAIMALVTGSMLISGSLLSTDSHTPVLASSLLGVLLVILVLLAVVHHWVHLDDKDW